MRVALVSDVHGNLTALEAVVADLQRRGADLVVHGGDLALMGPRPAEVVDRIRELGWPGVVGNTDELLWRPEEHERQLRRAPKLARLLERIFDAYAPDTRDRLGEERVAWLRTLSPEYRTGELTILHAQPDDLWSAPMADATDGELSTTYRSLATVRVGYGHIHRPFARSLEGLTVANAGSVGLPWDGDPRAAYLVFDDGVPNIIRVEYNVEEEVRAVRAAGHPDADRLAQMRQTGEFVPPRAAPQNP
jgi:predicted phosphodiesterase